MIRNSVLRCKVKLGALFIGFLFQLSIFAQTGIICGNVIDAKRKEPLIGASVIIAGTTVGAITDMDGNFRIEGVKPGKYTVSASYISYQTQVIPDVPVVARQEAVLKIELSDADLQLQNITVVAHRKIGTEMAVLNTIRKSLPVVNGVSAQQISKTQDSDAAEVLRRIPGVTIVDDRFIVVRGLAQRYNAVWLNNATTPSSETDSRAFSFDILPSSLIDNMMIYKSPSPELPADYTGGFVSVLTKNIPEGNSFSINYQVGYNSNATGKELELSKGTSLDLLGFGGRNRMLSSNSPSHLNDVSAGDAVAFTKQENKRWGVKQFTALPEQKVSLSYTRSLDLGGYTLSNISNLNYSNSYDSYETENNNFLSYDMKEDASSYRFRYDDTQFKNTTKLGALFNWSLMKGGDKYEFRNFFNQRGTSALSKRIGVDYYSDENIRKWESLYTSRTTYSGQLSGNHQLKEGVNKWDWTLGYAYANYNEPDRKVVKSMQEIREGKALYYVSEPTRYYQELKDHSGSVAVNYEQKTVVSDRFTPVFNAGLYAEYKNRDFDARRFVYNLLGTGYNRYADWDFTSVFTEENISSDQIYMKESTNKSDSYKSSNTLGAAYVSSKLNYGEKLNANIGVRLEYYKLQVDGYESDGIKPVNRNQDYTDLFPSVNMAYSLNGKNQVRLAYGRSMNRAEFREIVPYVYYDFGLNANISGNVNLKNAYIHNVDVRYEFYPSQGEVITLGAFYKEFTDPIEQTYYEAGSGLQYTFHNADKAEAIGVELDVKKQLDFVGLKGVSFVLNGAYIKSKIYFEKGAIERNRPMQGQSPFLINTGFFYQNDDKGVAASILYNRIGKRIETVGVAKQNPNDDIPDIYEMPRNSFDVSFSKKMGERVEVKGGIKNLLNSTVEYKQFLELTETTGGKRTVEQLVRSYRRGVSATIGVSLKF